MVGHQKCHHPPLESYPFLQLHPEIVQGLRLFELEHQNGAGECSGAQNPLPEVVVVIAEVQCSVFALDRLERSAGQAVGKLVGRWQG